MHLMCVPGKKKVRRNAHPRRSRADFEFPASTANTQDGGTGAAVDASRLPLYRHREAQVSLAVTTTRCLLRHEVLRLFSSSLNRARDGRITFPEWGICAAFRSFPDWRPDIEGKNNSLSVRDDARSRHIDARSLAVQRRVASRSRLIRLADRRPFFAIALARISPCRLRADTVYLTNPESNLSRATPTWSYQRRYDRARQLFTLVIVSPWWRCALSIANTWHVGISTLRLARNIRLAESRIYQCVICFLSYLFYTMLIFYLFYGGRDWYSSVLHIVYVLR